jgi:hypothetical protein
MARAFSGALKSTKGSLTKLPWGVWGSIWVVRDTVAITGTDYRLQMTDCSFPVAGAVSGLAVSRPELQFRLNSRVGGLCIDPGFFWANSAINPSPKS